MAKKESIRVMEQRKRACDIISFVIPKGGKYLVRAQALREGLTVAEMMRRAILARCGLESMPDFSMPHYQSIVTADDKESAERAITGLQLDEHLKHKSQQKSASKDDLYMSVMLSGQEMMDEYIKALLDILDALEDTDAPYAAGWTPPTQVKVTGKTLAIIRRLLSNIKIITDDSEDFDE
jgi:hypothetical protein